MPDVVFQVGEGAMSTPGAKTVLTGNPTVLMVSSMRRSNVAISGTTSR